MRYLIIAVIFLIFPIILIRVLFLFHLRRERKRIKHEADIRRAEIESIAQSILRRPGMKVRLIRQHGLKASGFFKRWGGSVFQVIQRRNGGYDVDLEPLGYPGKWGWMYQEEVEEIT